MHTRGLECGNIFRDQKYCQRDQKNCHHSSNSRRKEGARCRLLSFEATKLLTSDPKPDYGDLNAICTVTRAIRFGSYKLYWIQDKGKVDTPK